MVAQTQTLKSKRLLTFSFYVALVLTIGISIGVINTSTFDLRNSAATANETVFKPKIIDINADEISNPGRGLYQWFSQKYICPPNLISNRDVYARFSWDQIETSQDVYDWSPIQSFLDTAAKNNQRVIIGIFQSSKGSNSGVHVPSYLVKAPSNTISAADAYGDTIGGTYILNFNNIFVQKRFEKLIDGFNTKFGNNKSIYMVQMMSYGQYGEGYIPWNTPKDNVVWMTDKSAEWMVNAFHSRFSTKFKLTTLVRKDYFFQYALTKEPKWGWSRAALGEPVQMSNIDGVMALTNVVNGVNIGQAMKDRWMYAPVWTEQIGGYQFPNPENQFADDLSQVKKYHISYVGNGNFGAPYNVSPWKSSSTGICTRNTSSVWTQQQIDDFILAGKTAGYRYNLNTISISQDIIWGQNIVIRPEITNVGVAPTYDDYVLKYRIKNDAGEILWEGDSKLDFKKILPSANPTVISDIFTLPTKQNTSGNQTLSIIVESKTNPGTIINLAIDGKATDNSYTIGKVFTASASTPTQTITKTPEPTSTSTPTQTIIPTVTPTTTSSPVMTPTISPTSTNIPKPSITVTYIPIDTPIPTGTPIEATKVPSPPTVTPEIYIDDDNQVTPTEQGGSNNVTPSVTITQLPIEVTSTTKPTPKPQTIKITVVDQNGKTQANVPVSLNPELTTVTDSEGNAVFENVDPDMIDSEISYTDSNNQKQVATLKNDIPNNTNIVSLKLNSSSNEVTVENPNPIVVGGLIVSTAALALTSGFLAYKLGMLDWVFRRKSFDI